MAKKDKSIDTSSEDNAFELIEMAINDIDVLTRAFNLVSSVCEQREACKDDEEPKGIPEHLLN